MLKKLLKYDLKWCYRPLIIFYILSLFFSIVIRIVEQFNTSFIFLILDKICSAIFIILLVSIFINNVIRIWGRCINNIYKDESYLTHTLPVEKKTIFLSKVLTIIITMFTSFLVIIISLAIACLTKETGIFLKNSLESMSVLLEISVWKLLTIMIITVFLEVLFMVLSGILGIVIGYKSNNLKIIKSIISGFLLYIIPSVIIIIVMYIVGLFNKDIMQLFNSVNNLNSIAIKSVFIGGCLMYVIYNIIYYIAGKKVLEKGVNVD